MQEHFRPEIIEKLETYVYRLIDPRNGETFYVGKGKGNRVFAHAQAKIVSDDPGEKLARIEAIRRTGMEVSHVIHRHGMDDRTAFEVEAALMDAYPGLTNSATGHGSSARGSMHAHEVINRYSAKPASFQHKLILINVNRSADETSLYEATRYCWKVALKRANRAEYVLAVKQGLIVGVFTNEQWLPATQEHFPHRDPDPSRCGFIGKPVPQKIARLYVGKQIPECYRKPGAANPIKYTYR